MDVCRDCEGENLVITSVETDGGLTIYHTTCFDCNKSYTWVDKPQGVLDLSELDPEGRDAVLKVVERSVILGASHSTSDVKCQICGQVIEQGSTFRGVTQAGEDVVYHVNCIPYTDEGAKEIFHEAREAKAAVDEGKAEAAKLTVVPAGAPFKAKGEYDAKLNAHVVSGVVIEETKEAEEIPKMVYKMEPGCFCLAVDCQYIANGDEIGFGLLGEHHHVILVIDTLNYDGVGFAVSRYLDAVHDKSVQQMVAELFIAVAPVMQKLLGAEKDGILEVFTMLGNMCRGRGAKKWVETTTYSYE